MPSGGVGGTQSQVHRIVSQMWQRRIWSQLRNWGRITLVKKMGYSGADVARFLGINTSAVNYFRKSGGAHSDIFSPREHEGHEDKEKSFVIFVVINSKIA